MRRRSVSNRFVAGLGLLSFALGVQAETTLLDLSYRPHVDAATLANVIHTHIPESGKSILDIDISNSLLGDKGLYEVLPALVSNGDTKNARDRGSLHLTARTNQLTPQGVTSLIDSLLGSRSNITNAELTGAHDPKLLLKSLDLGWNHLHPERPGQKGFLKALQQLIENPTRGPTTVRLDRCGLGPSACRAIGKAVINRCNGKDKENVPPLSLFLCGNPACGDAGAAALAAAIRTVASSGKKDGCVVFESLDLSGCGIGDAGAEALALAIEDTPECCIRHLNLSNNQITDQGAGALGRALTSGGQGGGVPRLLHLDLSNNKDIGDRGVAAIANAIEKGKVPSVSLRSCHIHADGATFFGKALRALAMNKKAIDHKVNVDLSGNPLGVLRGKSKKDGGKYSASRLKSTATATAASYMNLFKKSVSPMLSGPSAESDDEEEKQGDDAGDPADDGLDPSLARCGAKALANGFLEEEGAERREKDVEGSKGAASDHFHIALRRCFFDHGAADALAAILVGSKEDLGIDLTIDVDLNPILEDEMISALHGDSGHEDLLREMADRHMEAMEALRESRARAAEASKAAAARVQAESRYEAAWDAPGSFEDEENEEWDSDADYDDEDESY
jgi:hypothetical protein